VIKGWNCRFGQLRIELGWRSEQNSENLSKAQKSKKTSFGIFLLTFCSKTGRIHKMIKIRKSAKVWVLAIDIWCQKG
jgi:hypothetical protein